MKIRRSLFLILAVGIVIGGLCAQVEAAGAKALAKSLNEQWGMLKQMRQQIGYVAVNLQEFITDTIQNGGLDYGAFKGSYFGQMRESLEPVKRWFDANTDVGRILPFDPYPAVRSSVSRSFTIIDGVYKRAPNTAKALIQCPIGRRKGELCDWAVAQAKAARESLLDAIEELERACAAIEKTHGKTHCAYCNGWVTISTDEDGNIRPCSQCGAPIEQ
ncbi:MAG: hypothetical protein GX442_25115 [Candidatus Riflebacteria bacterium]|nr:hypothetical protein [Candidatus Riflebacteria bacterium]